MGAYPGSESEQRVAYAELESAVTTIFQACGMSESDARLLAVTLAMADLRGVHSHGTMRVPDYVARLTRQGVEVRAGYAGGVVCGEDLGIY